MKLLKRIEDQYLYAKEPKEVGSMAEEFQAFVKEYINPDVTEENFQNEIKYGNLEGELQVFWEVYWAGARFSNDRHAQFERERKQAEEAKPFMFAKRPLGLALINGKVQPILGKEIINVTTCDLVQNHSEVKATCTFIVSSIANDKDNANGS